MLVPVAVDSPRRYTGAMTAIDERACGKPGCDNIRAPDIPQEFDNEQRRRTSPRRSVEQDTGPVAGCLTRGQPQRDPTPSCRPRRPRARPRPAPRRPASQADLEVEPIHVQYRVAFLAQVPFVPALE